MNTIQYLDLAKTRQRLESDYALAKALKVTPSSIYGYRAGRSHMDDATAAKVAALVGMHPGLVMLDMHRERAKTPAEQSIWQDIYTGFRTLLPLAKIGFGARP